MIGWKCKHKIRSLESMRESMGSIKNNIGVEETSLTTGQGPEVINKIVVDSPICLIYKELL